MKIETAVAALFVILSAAAIAVTADAADSCAASGDLQFVCGIQSAEDVVAIAGTTWLVAGSMVPGGGLYWINARTKATGRLYPTVNPATRADDRYSSCPGAPDARTFTAHGLHVRSEGAGNATLYVVNHGGREAIEVFDVHAGVTAALTWKGCVPMPAGIAANAVAAFADGTLLATVFTLPGKTLQDAFEGRVTGAVYQWRPGDVRFALLPGSELAGNNGIEVSSDSREFYVASTGQRSVVSFSWPPPVKRLREQQLAGFVPDNLHWASDGRLILGGTAATNANCPHAGTPAEWMKMMMTCPHGFTAAAIEPVKATLQILSETAPTAAFGGVSSATLIGSTLWFGSWSADRVAYQELH